MKIVILATTVLLVLLGGGVAAMMALKVGPFADQVAMEGAAVPAAAPKLEPPRFVDVAPLVIPVFSGSDLAAQIQINVKLEIVGSDNERKINRLLPKLNDAFLRDLYAFIPRLLRESDRLNVFVLKKRMQLIADKVAGPGVIESVLIQSVTDARKPSDA